MQSRLCPVSLWPPAPIQQPPAAPPTPDTTTPNPVLLSYKWEDSSYVPFEKSDWASKGKVSELWRRQGILDKL